MWYKLYNLLKIKDKTMKKSLPTLNLILSMSIFGTVGIFVREVGMPSGFVAMVRGFIGVAFILVWMLAMRKRISFDAIKANLLVLILSGAFIGINWIFLFESYRFTTVATATLCYYMAPVFLIIVAPIFLKERITVLKAICVAVSIVGMVFVSGVLDGGLPTGDDALGIIFGLLAAVFYTSVIVLNKKLRNIDAYTKTAVQLLCAAIAVLPYVIFAEEITPEMFGVIPVIMLVLVGVIHTGFAYVLYFGSLANVSAQSVSIYSYIDPILAVLLSALLLSEPMSLFGVIGAVLILASTLVASLDFSALKKR